jgi:histone H3/H4
VRGLVGSLVYLFQTAPDSGVEAQLTMTPEAASRLVNELSARLSRPTQPASGAEVREMCAKVAEDAAESCVALMRGFGVSANIETGRHRQAIEIATAIRALPTDAPQPIDHWMLAQSVEAPPVKQSLTTEANNANEALVVTQADREVAKEYFFAANRKYYTMMMMEITSPAIDRMVQAFARHRIASAKVDDGALREALARIAALRSPNNGDYIRIAEKALSAPVASAREALGDVIALVVAGREAWETLQDEHPTYNVTIALDKALEPFASRVCYDDEGGIAATHADPCTCGMVALAQPGRGGE